VPIDFVSRHAYSSREAQLIPFGSYQELAPPQDLLTQFGAPRAHLAGTALAGLPVHITEFNTSYRPDNPIHDTAYQAAYLAPVLAGGGDLADSFSYWTFSDVFEESNIPTAFFHGGFGLLTHRQVAKPTYHLYTFMARMGAQVLARGDDHLVCQDPSGRVTVLAWQPVRGTDAPAAAERHEVYLSVPMTGSSVPLTGTPCPDGTGVFMLRERVNEADGNAFAAWRELGRPMSPDARQLDVIRRCERPAVEHHRLQTVDGRVELRLSLARHEVTFIELDAVCDTHHEGLDDRRLLGVNDDRLVAEHERYPGAPSGVFPTPRAADAPGGAY
jgi:xylan 1,4-beta-xylosidase